MTKEDQEHLDLRELQEVRDYVEGNDTRQSLPRSHILSIYNLWLTEHAATTYWRQEYEAALEENETLVEELNKLKGEDVPF